jgi:hypothetical protein
VRPSLPLQAFVVVGDFNGHVGLGVKCAKEVATAIRGGCPALAQSCYTCQAFGPTAGQPAATLLYCRAGAAAELGHSRFNLLWQSALKVND